MYFNNFITSWYLNEQSALNNKNIDENIMIKCVVNSDRILCDLNYLFLKNDKVIVLAGYHEILTAKDILFDNSTIFSANNKDQLLRTKNKNNIYYCNVPKLKGICKNLKIKNYSTKKKEELINCIIDYYYQHNST